MIVELFVILLALYMGSRYGSLALGAISGIGLAILVFGFQMKPGTPPTDVIYIIIAAVTCAGMLQASGGMDWMIQLAERLLRRNPGSITLPRDDWHGSYIILTIDKKVTYKVVRINVETFLNQYQCFIE